MKSNITKIAVATLSAIALTSQLAAIPQTAVKAEDCRAESKYEQIAVAVEYGSMSKYDKSQIELLIMQLIAGEKGSVSCFDISYEYENLYYTPNERAGYVVDFAYQDDVGYIIALTDEYAVTPAEMVYGHNSPYYGKKGTYLYPATGNYYILSETGEITVAAQVDRPQGVIANSSGFVEGEKEVTVNYGDYSRLEVGDSYYIPEIYCRYSTELDKTHTNNCANVAGATALSYWNSYFDNDLLKLADDEMKSLYFYRNMEEDVVTAYMKKFYSYMNTNWIYGKWGGTLPENCYNGFMRLIRECGYEAYVVKVDDYDTIKWWIQDGVPVFLTHLYYAFSSVDEVTNVTSENKSGKLEFNATLYNGIDNFHTFVGYGYAEFTMYDKDGNSQNIHLIKVADGWGGAQYLHFDRCTPLSAAAIVVHKYRLSGC